MRLSVARPRWTWSIRNRILVPYLSLIVAMVGATGLATGHWAASRASRQFLDRGRAIAETLRRSSFPLTPAILRQMRGLGGAEFAILDETGRVAVGTMTGMDSTRLDLGPDESFERTWSSVGGAAYRVGVIERPATSGRVRMAILLPESGLQAVAWEARRGVLLFSLVGVALTVVSASWIGQTLSRPLSAILKSVRKIGKGDLRPRSLPVGRRDEIGELARGVARMARWLRKLRRQQVRTQRLRLIRQVSAGLAHELRNPLTAARMTLQIFIERNPDRDTEALRIALDEMGRMERQVKRFLQIARPEPPQFQDSDLRPVFDRALAALAATADHQGIEIERIDPNGLLPRVRVDPEQIGQVFANLLTNAIEAAGSGGKIRVEIAPRPGGLVAAWVDDDGPGVAPQDVPRLFQPFASTKPEGVGLGLALCRALVLEHGGSVSYRREGKWTRFEVLLPQALARPKMGMSTAFGDRAAAIEVRG